MSPGRRDQIDLTEGFRIPAPCAAPAVVRLPMSMRRIEIQLYLLNKAQNGEWRASGTHWEMNGNRFIMLRFGRQGGLGLRYENLMISNARETKAGKKCSIKI